MTRRPRATHPWSYSLFRDAKTLRREVLAEKKQIGLLLHIQIAEIGFLRRRSRSKVLSVRKRPFSMVDTIVPRQSCVTARNHFKDRHAKSPRCAKTLGGVRRKSD
jgi:hypothetical protein